MIVEPIQCSASVTTRSVAADSGVGEECAASTLRSEGRAPPPGAPAPPPGGLKKSVSIAFVDHNV